MAELLVMVEDRVSPDPHRNVKLPKRGDVVVACPDGWPWSPAERTAPFWTIVRCPGLPADATSGLLAPEPGDEIVQRTLQGRAFGLDLDALGERREVTPDELFGSLRRRKQPVADPDIFEVTQ